MYVCICIYMLMYNYNYMYILTCVHVYLCTYCIHVLVYTLLYIIDTCTTNYYVYTYNHITLCIHTYQLSTYIRKHIHKYTYMHYLYTNLSLFIHKGLFLIHKDFSESWNFWTISPSFCYHYFPVSGITSVFYKV